MHDYEITQRKKRENYEIDQPIMVTNPINSTLLDTFMKKKVYLTEKRKGLK